LKYSPHVKFNLAAGNVKTENVSHGLCALGRAPPWGRHMATTGGRMATSGRRRRYPRAPAPGRPTSKWATTFLTVCGVTRTASPCSWLPVRTRRDVSTTRPEFRCTVEFGSMMSTNGVRCGWRFGMTNPRWFHSYALGSLLLATVGAPVTNGQPATTSMPPTSLPASQVEVLEGIPFAQPEGTTLRLDLARPRDGDGPYPAVVILFGGGWISGSRTGMRERIEYLASHGYVAVAPDYRLAPQHPFPAAVADARECVRWLRRHADEYDVDPDRIGAVGYSAGGHLACMLGLASDADRFGPDDLAPDGTSARVQAVVNYFGPGRPGGEGMVRPGDSQVPDPLSGRHRGAAPGGLSPSFTDHLYQLGRRADPHLPGRPGPHRADVTVRSPA
jgi:hypothetical protein